MIVLEAWTSFLAHSTNVYRLAAIQDKYVRSVADFLNLQERTKRDMENARNFAIQKFAIDLLDSVDNFDRALIAVPDDKANAPRSEENKDLVDLVTGLKMTEHILLNTLRKHGLERFDPSEPGENGKAQKFDPNVHEATFMTKVPGLEDGDVMYTQSKGFKLNGRVLRVSGLLPSRLSRMQILDWIGISNVLLQAAKVGVVRNT